MMHHDGVVLVTGALGGMGSASARSFASTGSRLLLTDRDPARLAEAAEELSALGASCTTLACELADPFSVADLAHAVGDQGGLRTLVHTAALSPSMGDWKAVLTVDYLGTVRLLDGLLPHAGAGTAAICFASIAAHQGHPISAETLRALDEPLQPDFFDDLEAMVEGEITSGLAYIWAKTAVVRLCERAAVPWGRRGARIVSLSPGLIDTPMGRLELDNPRKRPLLTMTPLARARRDGQSVELPGHCDDIAATVAFLASDAASFISGCDIRVDGGIVAALSHPPLATR
jgi:NAD(P)-dependent dehydrogenase (short-subunit alcohol dehydrogenase family)